MPTRIVFNLYPFGELIYLPSAFLVETDAQDQLGYPVQRATPATIGPHGHELTPALARLFELVESLTPKNLETRFKPPKAKAPTPLAQLLADTATKPSVEKFIFEKLDALLVEIARDRWPLALDLERKTIAKNVQIAVAADELVPHIAFTKTDAGVEYRFQLGTEDEKWPISSRDVRPLTNTDPAWLLVDYALFRVPGINGNMVRPFRNKDAVHIPPDKARVYFRQFVAKSAGRTRIEAEGFAVTSTRELLKTRLVPTENVLEKAWYLKAVFVYPGAEFAFGERRDRLTAVDFADEEIAVRQVLRDAVLEQEKIDFLAKNGLATEGKLFRAGSSLESLLDWLAEQGPALQAAGLAPEAPLVEGRPIALLTGKIELSARLEGDWFDLHGQVRAGDFSFPFKVLLPHLRRRDRFYRLPDDTFFHIPDAWFARYAELADALANSAGDALRLPKALFTLLPAAGPDDLTGSPDLPEIDPEKIDYQPPADLKADLRPYQMQGVKWLVGHYRAGFGACLADDMGLGKTLQTIALLLYAKETHQTPPPTPPQATPPPTPPLKGRGAPLTEGKLPSPSGEGLGEGLTQQGSDFAQKETHQTPPPTPPLKGRGAALTEGKLPSPSGEGLGEGLPGEGLGVGLSRGGLGMGLSREGPRFTQLDLFQSYRAELRPLNALVVLPASLVFNWQNELARFAPSLFVCAHTGPKRLSDARALAGHDVVLTTYHTARQDLDLLKKINWHVIVLDESQQIKNRASEVSKVVLSLQADCKISLSGTPIENSLADLWTQMEFINPATLGSFREFREQFILPIEKRDDAAAKQRLFRRVRPFFLRRTKEEVAPELPALTEQLFFSEMTAAQQKLYDRTKSAVRNEILALFDDPKTRVLALQALTRLRQLASDPRLVETDYKGGAGKFDDVLAQWDTVRRAGHKVLFFSSFERHLQLFRREFEAAGQSFAWLTGDTPASERAREVARFQQDPAVQAFFMTVKAGGVGLNLTAADYVFLLDPWWNPAAEDQAIARAHRIGQTRPVTALRFLARDTVEEKIRQLQERKKKLGQALFAGQDEAAGLTREDLEGLLG